MSVLTRATIFASVAACWTNHRDSRDPVTTPAEAPVSPTAPASTTPTAVSGTLIQEGGEPGAQVMVQLAKLDGSTPVQSVRTDNTGHYRFDQVAPGRYQIVIQWKPGPGASPLSRVIDVVADVPIAADFTLPAPPIPIQPHPIAKPYGAPPARRRLV